jgi:hypothetical protein
MLLMLAGCSERTASTEAAPTTVTSRTSTTTQPHPVERVDHAAMPRPTLVPGRYCKTMRQWGWSYARVLRYWHSHGRPDHMDADLNGIPCETVYPDVSTRAVAGDGLCSAAEQGSNSADCDQSAYPGNVASPGYGPSPSPGPWPAPGYHDHDWPSDPGPGSPSRPIQPYPATPGDPNDRDGDGVACEYGCKN